MALGRRHGLVGIAATLALGVLGILVPAQASTAATPAAPVKTVTSAVGGNVGIDVSFPQCADSNGKVDKFGIDHVAYPAHTPFAVVGVNHGVAGTYNSCFVSQYNDAQALAGGTAEPLSSVYLNTGDPALAATWWPDSNLTQKDKTVVVNPKGTCAHKAGAACAYVYGYSMAQDALDILKGYVATSSISALPTMFWLDVETTNTWQTDKTANAYSIRGMLDYLTSQNLPVGIYSTSYQFGRIAGTIGSTSAIAGYPSWLAGTSPATAAKDCEEAGLTPGSRVWMLQYVYAFDEDYACKTFPTAHVTVSPSAASLVGTKLTAARGSWGPGTISYSYQWLRNGVAISGATKNTRTTSSYDTGKTLSVEIRGKASGYRTTVVASTGVSILGKITPKTVSIAGKTVVGQVLTAQRGTWSPSGVTYTYAWYSGTTLIVGATSTTYTVAVGDLGQKITLQVTGSKTGYRSVTKSATSAVVTAAP